MIGVQKAQAYTTTDLVNDGWTQVTDMSSVTLADNYFIFVDGKEGKYSMVNAMPKGILTSVARPMYQEIADPTSDFCQVWSIENYDAENYAIKNNSDDYYLNSNGQWWSSHVSKDYGETSRMKIISIGEGKYRLQTTGTSTFWGPYKDGGSVVLGTADGMDFEQGAADSHYAAIAANKVESNAPGFYIYSISRTAFNAVCRRASTLVSEGWTKVTEAEGLGRSGYYYAFLDASENGGESGFALTGTGGRPKYKLEKDPIKNHTQLWTTEAHGSGYAIKNVEDGKYIYCAANWNMQATDNINTNNTDFIPAVTDGVWILSNSISTGEFVGNYKNSPYNPTDGEDLAANKASRKGKRTFLIYSIPFISGVATELPDGGAMTANQWYYFDITAAADNYNATATTLGDIICTTDGSDQAVSPSGNVTLKAKNNDLAIGRYYVRSSSDNNLVVDVSSYTYTVSAATADKEYIQPGQTITVSYTVSTNDQDATLTQDYSGVTFGGEAISVTPTASGFTFAVPAVTVSGNYTLSIPAGVIGYEAGDTYNAAQEFILKTPSVFDGYFFIKQNDADKYVSRGGNDNTEAILDSYGIPVQITTDADNVSLVKFMDNNRYLYAGSTSVYSDKELAAGGNNVKWTIASYSGGYSFYNSAREKYMAAGVGAEEPNVPAAVRADAAYAWTLEATSAHPAKMQAVKDAQAAAAATAAGISASTQADLKTYLSENYGETPVAITGVPSVVDQFQKKADKGNGKKKTFMTETKNGLSHGLYRLRVNAFERIAGLDAVLSAGGAPGLAYVYANDQKIQLCSLAETYKAGSAWSSGSPADISKPEGYYVNNTTSADAAFDAGYYVNDVYIYLDTDNSSIEFGIETTNSYGATDNSQWICYNNFSLVKFDAKPTDKEKTDLASAISTAEGKTLGFEDGEYAPYSNIDAIAKLAEAKAINPETASGSAVVAVTTALTGVTWTANVGEMNAVYNGDFSLSTNDGAPAGWVLTGATGTGNSNNTLGGAYRPRAFVLTSEAGNYAKLATFGQGDGTRSAFYVRFDDRTAKTAVFTYGNTEGYTMPLKTNTIYKLTAQAGGWGKTKDIQIAVVNSSDANVVAKPVTLENIDASGSVSNYEMYFVVPADGNYKLQITNASSSEDNAAAVSNIVLKSTDALNFADDAAVPTYAPGTYPSVKITRTLADGKWATAVYPFAVSGVDNIAVLDSYNSETGIIGFTTATESKANEPFLMRSTEGTTEISLSNVAVAATAEPVVTKNNASLKGVYASGKVPVSDENNVRYVVSSNKLYKVDSNVNIKPFRAYFELADGNSSARLSFNFDDATGINTIEATEAEDCVKDGKYLENGKIVIVKNGIKYSANGQKLN